MKKLDFKTKILPNLGIALLFLIASVMYFYPVLEGKIIYAGDNINGTAAVQESARHYEATGERTWWTGSMFSGMPNYQIGGGQYLINKILTPFFNFFLYGGRNYIFIFFYYLVAFFVLLRTFKINKWISMAGAFSIALSSYFFIIIAAQHHGKTMSITWMTLVVVGFLLIYRKFYGWGSILTMFFIIIGFFIHPQMSYYICMLIGVLFFAELAIHWKEKRWKDFGIASAIFFASFLIGLGCGSANIFANQEYAEQTMRGGHSDLEKVTDETNKTKGLDLDYATAWSYGIGETMTLLIPNYEGGASGYSLGTDSKLYKELVSNGVPRAAAKQFCEAAPTYHGEKAFTSGPVYIGAIICFLFLLGLLIVKGPYKWALLIATLFSIFLAWGHNLMPLTELFFNYFPMYNKFRAVESILIVAEITMPLLGFLALKTISEREFEFEKLKKYILVAAGITGGLCLFLILFVNQIDVTSSYDEQLKTQLPEFAYNALLQQRADMISSDAWRSLIFILLGSGLTFAYAHTINKQKNEESTNKANLWFGCVLALLIIADMWSVDKRFCNNDNFRPKKEITRAFAMQPYEKELLKDTSYFRVLNLSTNTFNEARTSYYLKSIGGYSAAKLRRYQDLIDEHIIPEMNPLFQAISESAGFQTPIDGNKLFPVLNMLNMKYALIPLQNGEVVPIENPYSMGNAWFVDSLLIVNNANEESNALSIINLRKTAVLDKSFAKMAEQLTTATDAYATIKLTTYTPSSVEYTSQSSVGKTAVFSEIYYPYGWKATIDGKHVEHYRVNYMLRAINIPAGKHQIVFRFEPDSVQKGNLISMICFSMMLLTIFGYTGYYIYSKSKKQK